MLGQDVKCLSVSVDGEKWTSISKFGASVAGSGGVRATSEQFTMDGDTPIITLGKRAPTNVTVRYKYHKDTNDPFKTVRDQCEAAGGSLYLQWSVDGSEPWHKTSKGVYILPPHPFTQEIINGDTITSKFVITCGSIT